MSITTIYDNSISGIKNINAKIFNNISGVKINWSNNIFFGSAIRPIINIKILKYEDEEIEEMEDDFYDDINPKIIIKRHVRTLGLHLLSSSITIIIACALIRMIPKLNKMIPYLLFIFGNSFRLRIIHNNYGKNKKIKFTFFNMMIFNNC